MALHLSGQHNKISVSIQELTTLDNGTLSLEEELIGKLDYGIAGIHTQCYRNQGKAGNTANLIKCMKHPRIKLISHPDDDHTPLDYSLLIPAAGEYGVAIEVNNSSLIKKASRLNCCENYHTILELCMKYQVPVIINSDAHDPYYVGEFRQALALIKREGFDENLVLNYDEHKLLTHLDIAQEDFDFESGIPDMGV